MFFTHWLPWPFCFSWPLLSWSMTPREHRGGGTGDETVREVVLYSESPRMFIDKEGYNGGDAKLIYTLVSYEYDTDKIFTGVKITDMERDPCGTSYTVFPDQVRCGGITYPVVGNFVKDNGDGTFTDVDGDIKLNYYLSGSWAIVSSISYGKSEATSLTLPAKITLIGEGGKIRETKVNYSFAPSITETTLICNVTIVVPSLTNGIPYFSISNCSNLQSLRVIYENDTLESEYTHPGLFICLCNSLTDLWLPNHMNSLYISYCPSLGSQAKSDNPFIFNSNVTDLFRFHHCSGIKYLEFGPNMTQATLQYSDVLYECPNLEVIYNTSPNVTEDDIAKCIVNGGSNHVLLFNNPGGTFTKYASITDSAISMPEGTLNGVDIPWWTHKDGTTMFASGGGSTYNITWSTDVHEYSYYYFALHSSCTVTYHVSYKDGDGNKQTDTKTQTVPCMYNMLLYDETTYPDETLRNKMVEQKSGLEWINSVVPGGGYRLTLLLGQSVTLYCDLDLYMWLDDTVSIKDSDYVTTVNWDYIVPGDGYSSVKTYSYIWDFQDSGEIVYVQLPTLANFIDKAGIPPDVGTYLTENYALWCTPDGNVLYPGETEKTYKAGALTLTPIKETYNPVAYHINNGKTSILRYMPSSFYGNMVLVPNLFFTYTDRSFVDWCNGDTHVDPLDICLAGTSELKASWSDTSEDPETTVTYNNLYDRGSGTTDVVPYDYGSTTKLASDHIRPGHRLVGWSYTDSQNVNFSLDVPVTMLNNLTLYAVWEEVPPTVITDNLLVSEENATGTYDVGHLFIGIILDGDTPEYTVTFYDSTGTNVVDNPTAIGVYVIKVGYQVFRDDDDVTNEYYSGYDGEHPVTYQCYNAFLTIYSGDHSTVID